MKISMGLRELVVDFEFLMGFARPGPKKKKIFYGYSRVSAKKHNGSRSSLGASAAYNLSPLRSSRHKTFRSSRHKTFRSSRHKTFRSSRQDLSFIKVPPCLHAYNAPLASRTPSLHVVTPTARLPDLRASTSLRLHRSSTRSCFYTSPSPHVRRPSKALHIHTSTSTR